MKVFVISLHKTGTTSLTHFLEKLGYTVTVAEPHLFYEAWEGDFENIDIFLERYDAFQDDPWYMLYEYAYNKFPDAKFIYIDRNEEEWLESVQKFYGKGRFNNKVRRLLYGSANSLEFKDLYLKKFRLHKEEVFNFFNGKSNFIKIKISDDQDAINLQSFLGKKIRFRKFPHFNKQPEAKIEKRIKKIKHFFYSFFGLKPLFRRFLYKKLGREKFIQKRNILRYYKTKLRVQSKRILNRSN